MASEMTLGMSKGSESNSGGKRSKATIEAENAELRQRLADLEAKVASRSAGPGSRRGRNPLDDTEVEGGRVALPGTFTVKAFETRESGGANYVNFRTLDAETGSPVVPDKVFRSMLLGRFSEYNFQFSKAVSSGPKAKSAHYYGNETQWDRMNEDHTEDNGRRFWKAANRVLDKVIRRYGEPETDRGHAVVKFYRDKLAAATSE